MCHDLDSSICSDLHIEKTVNVPTSLNNLKIKVDDLGVGKLRCW